MSKSIIIDNFLDQEKFDDLQTLMHRTIFPWYYSDGIDFGIQSDDGRVVYPKERDRDKFMFTHTFLYKSIPCSNFYKNLIPILEIINPLSVWRIKANLLTRTPNIIENLYHHDISHYDDENGKTINPEKLKQWTTSILYMNTNNGYTKFEDGTKVESIANRLVTFPANMKHTGTSCTDEKTRVVINFNYFK